MLQTKDLYALLTLLNSRMKANTSIEQCSIEVQRDLIDKRKQEKEKGRGKQNTDE
jgi:hypothetical protein